MKPSRYNVLVPDQSSGGLSLYNTRTGALSSFAVWEAAAVRRLLTVADATSGDGRLLDALCEQHHLIADDVDELALVRARKQCGAWDAGRLDVIAMPTLQCNFACSYCYETPRGTGMSAGTEAALVAWLRREIPLHPLTLLQWFGGEPLLQLDLVVRVTLAATAAATSGRAVTPHITTNGWLLDAKAARRLVAAGILEYQVTIDGPADTHDRLRVLRGGGATFQRVFDNVVGLLESEPRTRVSLRCNFNETNLGRLSELLAAFPAAVRPRMRMAFEPIFGHCALAPSPSLPAEAIAAKLDDLRAEARRLGYGVPEPVDVLRAGKLVYCYAERENQVVIGPEGEVFKCSACGFTEAERVGRLFPDGRIERDQDRWSRWVAPGDLSEKCEACTWLPLCMGGCRKMRLEKAQRTLETGCTLVATNASHVLKMVSLRGIEAYISHTGMAPVGREEGGHT